MVGLIYRARSHETFNGGSRRHSPFGTSKSGEIRVVSNESERSLPTLDGDLFKNYATSRSVIPVQDKISKVVVHSLLWLTFLPVWSVNFSAYFFFYLTSDLPHHALGRYTFFEILLRNIVKSQRKTEFFFSCWSECLVSFNLIFLGLFSKSQAFHVTIFNELKSYILLHKQ